VGFVVNRMTLGLGFAHSSLVFHSTVILPALHTLITFMYHQYYITAATEASDAAVRFHISYHVGKIIIAFNWVLSVDGDIFISVVFWKLVLL